MSPLLSPPGQHTVVAPRSSAGDPDPLGPGRTLTFDRRAESRGQGPPTFRSPTLGQKQTQRGSPRQWRVFWGQLCNTLEGLCKEQQPEPHRAFVCPSASPDIAEDKRGLREEPEGLGSPGDPQRGTWGFSALLGTHRVRVLALLGIHREAQPAGLCVPGAIICLSFPSPFFCLHPPALPAASGADLGSPPPHFSHLFPALPRQTPVGGRLGGSWETRSTKGGAGLRGHCQPPRAGAPQPVPALLACVPAHTCTHTGTTCNACIR